MSNFSFEKTIYLLKKTQILNVLRILTNSVAFSSKFTTFSNFYEIHVFLQRTKLFWEKPKVWKFWEILLFQSHSTAIFLGLYIFKNVKNFFEKNHLSFEKTPKLWTFRESYQFSRILWQICYLWRFLKNWRVFLKHASNFSEKPKLLTVKVLRILALPVAFFGNFAGSSNFSKRQVFFENTIYVLK